MDESPYSPGIESNGSLKTRATRWMIWVGTVALSLAGLFLLATVIGLISSFNAIANSSSTSPDPAVLARDINTALMFSIPAVPLAITGIVFLILGFIIRQPVSRT